MTRSATLPAEAVRRVQRDPRFLDAQDNRIPDPGWRTRGRCLSWDPEVFFPNAAEDPSPALAVCSGCVVRGACLAAALDSAECDGVWGATTPEDRRAMRQVWLDSGQRTQRV